jgi:hypothetical protein
VNQTSSIIGPLCPARLHSSTKRTLKTSYFPCPSWSGAGHFGPIPKGCWRTSSPLGRSRQIHKMDTRWAKAKHIVKFDKTRSWNSSKESSVGSACPTLSTPTMVPSSLAVPSSATTTNWGLQYMLCLSCTPTKQWVG